MLAPAAHQVLKHTPFHNPTPDKYSKLLTIGGLNNPAEEMERRPEAPAP
jgi:hypothetical protein